VYAAFLSRCSVFLKAVRPRRFDSLFPPPPLRYALPFMPLRAFQRLTARPLFAEPSSTASPLLTSGSPPLARRYPFSLTSLRADYPSPSRAFYARRSDLPPVRWPNILVRPPLLRICTPRVSLAILFFFRSNPIDLSQVELLTRDQGSQDTPPFTLLRM